MQKPSSKKVQIFKFLNSNYSSLNDHFIQFFENGEFKQISNFNNKIHRAINKILQMNQFACTAKSTEHARSLMWTVPYLPFGCAIHWTSVQGVVRCRLYEKFSALWVNTLCIRNHLNCHQASLTRNDMGHGVTNN